jgi:hypothetical protein
MATPATFRCYKGYQFLGLIVGCIIGLAFTVIPFVLIASVNDSSSGHLFLTSNDWLGTLSGIGVLLLLAESIFVIAYDWRGAVTVRGAAKAQIMHKGKLVNTAPSYVLLYILFPEIMLPIYLIRTALDQRQVGEQRKLSMQHQIATLEAQLGILPPTSGTCRACHKPLQVGAEFCQYCGVSVVERPKICPSCSTTALPDAKFCPKCRTPLA